MKKHLRNPFLKCILLLVICCCLSAAGTAQRTQIKGFANASAGYSNNDEIVSFFFGEQDLFITSDVSDRISFLGETVFKYSSNSPTHFDIGLERLIIKYNIKGNHNILFGKHHTPVNFWNDSYHHGRVFFPTIFRPYIFKDHVLEIHTTGIGFQGLNLTDFNIGYELMVGNGIGSGEIKDNNKYKSITAAIHFKPVSDLRIGLSHYFDKITDAEDEREIGDSLVSLNHFFNNASLAYFGNKFELLTELSHAYNSPDSGSATNVLAYYAYAGIKIAEKYVPYVRYDKIMYEDNEAYLHADDKQSFVVGFRYEFNFLATAKIEYEYFDSHSKGATNRVNFQFAVGF